MMHSTHNSDSREDKLPKWAQNLISSLREELKNESAKREALEQASEILHKRNWFVIHGPKFSNRTSRNLWYLDTDHPTCLCSLGRGDILLVGRKQTILGTRAADPNDILYFRYLTRTYKNGKSHFSLDLEIEEPDAIIVAVLILGKNNSAYNAFNAELEFNGFIYHGVICLEVDAHGVAIFSESI